MKKCMLVLAMLGIMPVFGANGYEYSRNNSQYTTTRSTYAKTNTGRKAGGYHNTITNNFYYNQPTTASSGRGQMYREYGNNDYVAYERPVEQKTVVRETKPARSSQERKYFLAHPFFQPLKGKFGSVTDLSYAKNSFKFDILDGKVLDLDVPVPSGYESSVYEPVGISGKADISQLLVKADLSFGLSDTLALMIMAQYDSTKVAFKDWSGGEPGNEVKNSGLNIFGVGLQNRFVDNDEWIAMFSGFFQHQKDTANTFIFDVKVGYKVDRTTIYGLARLGYSNLTNGDMYGALVDDPSGDWLILSYKQDVKDVVYVEGGMGAFSVLNKYAYLGGELIYGYYDWHNQLNLKGTIGVQPRDSFALSLYGSISLYDSAKGKTKNYANYDVNPDMPTGMNPASTLAYTTGKYKINSYNEWKIGVQAILYF